MPALLLLRRSCSILRLYESALLVMIAPSLAAHCASPVNVIRLSCTGASQDTGGKDASKSEPADRGAPEIMAVDKDTQEYPKEALTSPPKHESAKHGGKGDGKEGHPDKEAEQAKEKDRKKKYKVDEELLQAFRYFDRNCKRTCSFRLLSLKWPCQC